MIAIQSLKNFKNSELIDYQIQAIEWQGLRGQIADSAFMDALWFKSDGFLAFDNEECVGIITFVMNASEYVQISHLASSGTVAGTGKLLFYTVTHIAMKMRKGIILESSQEAIGFYNRLGMDYCPQVSEMTYIMNPVKTFKFAIGQGVRI